MVPARTTGTVIDHFRVAEYRSPLLEVHTVRNIVQPSGETKSGSSLPALLSSVTAVGAPNVAVGEVRVAVQTSRPPFVPVRSEAKKMVRPSEVSTGFCS